MKITIIALLLTMLISCTNQDSFMSVQGLTQGTTYHMKYKGSMNYKYQIDSLLGVFDKSLSNYDSASVISRSNKEYDVAIDDSLYIAFFSKSKFVYEESDGAFDVTISPIVNAWKFGFKNDSLLPDKKKVDSLLQYVGFGKIAFENNRLTKPQHVELISNAIAQGMSVDYIAAWLEGKQIHDYMVEIGGEIRAKGVSETTQPWKIGIDIPKSDSTRRELKAIVALKDNALATSGNYRKYYIEGGKKYSHTIDPKTGYPVQHNLLSATILTANCGLADAFATACMVIGVEKSKILVEKHSELEAYFIYEDEGEMKTWMSAGFKNSLVEELQ